MLFRMAGLEGGAEALLCWRIWRAAVGLIGLILYLRGPGRTVYDAESAAGKGVTTKVFLRGEFCDFPYRFHSRTCGLALERSGPKRRLR